MRTACHLVILLSALACTGGGAAGRAECGWRMSPIVVPAGRSSLDAIDARGPRDVWAVGERPPDDSGLHLGSSLAEHWDGVRWRVTPTPAVRSALYGVAAVSAHEAWAVGETATHVLVEHWDGSHWRVAQTPYRGNGTLYSLAAVSARDVWAVGVRLDDGGRALIEHWDGRAWRVFAPPPQLGGLALGAAAADTAGDVWAPCAERSAAGRWRLRLPPGEDATACAPSTVGAAAPEDVWAITGDGVLHRWDGAHWLRPPQIDGTEAGDVQISALAVRSPTDVWAGGFLTQGGDSGYERLEHWDGAAWTVTPGALPQDEWTGVTDLSVLPDGEVWASAWTERGARVERRVCAP